MSEKKHDPNVKITPVPDEYDPPSDLAACQRDARHFYSASKLHLSTIEVLSRELVSHRRDRPERDVHKLLLENRRLREENTRLRRSLTHATEQWQRYSYEARTTKELFAYAKWAAPKIAVKGLLA